MDFVEPEKPWHSSTPAAPLPPAYGCASGCTEATTGPDDPIRRRRPVIDLRVGREEEATSEWWHACWHRETALGLFRPTMG
jgi:hypothetical protein